MHMRRQFVRIPFQTAVVIGTRDGNRQATLIDISLTGALVHAPDCSDIARECRLAVPLSGEIVLSFQAEILHNHCGQLGCRFTGMSPATFSHLVRLLELNVGDAGQIERELQTLARQPHLASAAAH